MASVHSPLTFGFGPKGTVLHAHLLIIAIDFNVITGCEVIICIEVVPRSFNYGPGETLCARHCTNSKQRDCLCPKELCIVSLKLKQAAGREKFSAGALQ